MNILSGSEPGRCPAVVAVLFMVVGSIVAAQTLAPTASPTTATQDAGTKATEDWEFGLVIAGIGLASITLLGLTAYVVSRLPTMMRTSMRALQSRLPARTASQERKEKTFDKPVLPKPETPGLKWSPTRAKHARADTPIIRLQSNPLCPHSDTSNPLYLCAERGLTISSNPTRYDLTTTGTIKEEEEEEEEETRQGSSTEAVAARSNPRY